jgi:hypothetical protein
MAFVIGWVMIVIALSVDQSSLEVLHNPHLLKLILKTPGEKEWCQ